MTGFATLPDEPSRSVATDGRRRRVWGLAVVAAAVALLGTGLVLALPGQGGGSSLSSALADVGRPASSAVVVGRAERLAALLTSVANRSGVAAEQADVTQATDLALSTPAGRQALFDADIALAGHVFPGTTLSARASAAAPLKASGNDISLELIASESPGVNAYYVNGVNTPYTEALAQKDALASFLHTNVVLVYNPSFRLLSDMNIEACTRALERSGLGDAHVAQDSSWTQWLAEKASDAVTTGLKVACAGIDLAGTAGVKTLSVAAAAVDLASVIAQRATGADWTGVQADLVDAVERDINNGTRVVLIGHSQGTMFTRGALQQVQTWWADRKTWDDPKVVGCPGVGASPGETTLADQRPVPLGALYISPAFGSLFTAHATANEDLDRGAERYVLIRGDAIFAVSPLVPTTDPMPGQIDPSSPIPTALQLHKLDTYLHDPSSSKDQIAAKFADLSDYVNGVPGINNTPCDTSTTMASTTTVEPPTTDLAAPADATASTDTASTDTTPAENTTTTADSTPPTDATPIGDTTTTAPTGSDVTYTGGFAPPDPSNNPGHLQLLSNKITIVVHPDGSADGSYSVSYTMNDTLLTPDVLPGCVETFSASGTLKLTADGGGTGTIENLTEATPTASGCWPGWSSDGRSQGGWRLNTFDSHSAQGGVDVYGNAFGFNIAAS